jgi:hypothetical protein
MLEPIVWTVIDINSVKRVGMTLGLDIINPSSSCRIMIYGLTCCALLITWVGFGASESIGRESIIGSFHQSSKSFQGSICLSWKLKSEAFLVISRLNNFPQFCEKFSNKTFRNKNQQTFLYFRWTSSSNFSVPLKLHLGVAFAEVDFFPISTRFHSAGIFNSNSNSTVNCEKWS